ncbi:hypothetical protein [Azospirillum sp. ST 5-10]|uniref:hypothetical protein n=1 Tax=unclassified Azospirillum TaxID=2630922 RepID=UPI003F4A574C
MPGTPTFPDPRRPDRPPAIAPLAVLDWWATVVRASAPLVATGWLIAGSPLHWAPPLWIAALTAGRGGPSAGGGPAAGAAPAPVAAPAPARPASRRRRRGTAAS